MAIGSDLGGVAAGLINSGQSLPTIDIQPLLDAINANKTENTGLINNLPAELAPLYAQYQAALTGAGNTLQGTTTNIGQNLLDQTQALYGPSSPAVLATLAGLKQQDYSTLPGTLNALKANLAASGGLNRGAGARAIQSAVLAPASQYSQQAATVTGQQLQTQQANVQNALNRIASMDDVTAQQIFGMTKEQATSILTSGRQDLQNQLAQLINTNNQALNSTLGLRGIAAQNAYENALTRNAQQAAIVGGLTNLAFNDIPNQGPTALQQGAGTVGSIFGGGGTSSGGDGGGGGKSVLPIAGEAVAGALV